LDKSLGIESSMKLPLFATFLAVVVCLVGSASAATTFSGNFTSNMKKTDNTTNVPIGNRYIVVVDTAGNGFGAATDNSIASGTGFVTGSSFGGDEIIVSGTVVSAGRAATTSLDVSPWAGKPFAVIWFDSLTSSNTTTADGDKYGFVTDPSWTIPSTPGTFTFTTSPAGAGDMLLKNAPGATTLTVGLSAAPEPSRALLLGFGALGFMMRRRRK
jgi:hypothetical protein